MGAFSQTFVAPGSRLESDRITGIALLTGTSTTYDVEVSGTDWLVVQGDLTGAALGDLSVTVTLFEEDGVTLSGIQIAPVVVVANILAGGHAYSYGKYDVLGVGRVRIAWKNNNAGTQTLTRGSWRAKGF